jgi:hypothetical protein
MEAVVKVRGGRASALACSCGGRWVLVCAVCMVCVARKQQRQAVRRFAAQAPTGSRSKGAGGTQRPTLARSLARKQHAPAARAAHVCVCVCVCLCLPAHAYTHTHTRTHARTHTRCFASTPSQTSACHGEAVCVCVAARVLRWCVCVGGGGGGGRQGRNPMHPAPPAAAAATAAAAAQAAQRTHTQRP